MASRLALLRTVAAARAPVVQMLQSRAFAAPAADPFMDIFKKQQQTYRSLLEKTKDLKVPDKTDKKGIQEFASKLAAIRQELGLYWAPEDYKQAVHTRMDDLKAETDGTMRDFLSKCNTIGVDPTVQKSLLGALDGIEAKLGRPMLASGDKEGQPLFDAALEGVRKETGYDKMSDKDMLAKGDYDTAEKIVKDLQEMNAQEFFDAYAPNK